MLRESVTDLLAFIAVAQDGSFTRAAARLGVTQSARRHQCANESCEIDRFGREDHFRDFQSRSITRILFLRDATSLTLSTMRS
jgi:hypothetical protein